MAQNQPLWLKMVHRVERAVGSHVETFVTSDAYFDLLTQATKTRRRLLQTTESLSREWLHLWNLPASSDVRRLREQLSRVERTLAEVAKEVNDRAENGARPTPDKPQ
jgi:hypothetical protein